MTVILVWPGLTFAYSWWKSNLSLQELNDTFSLTDGDGFAGLPLPTNFDPGDELSPTSRNCGNGRFLGESDDSSWDCSSICTGGSEGQFEYKFIEEGHKVIVNNSILKPGAWCLPRELARCNLNISYALSGINGYECRTAYPLVLGGITGNRIVACAPFNSIVDRKENVTYRSFVPPDFELNSLDEMLSDGSFRFTCHIPLSQQGNFQPLKDLGLGGRFQLTTNVCGTFESTGTYSLDSKACVCDAKDEKNVLLRGEFHEDEKVHQFRPCTTCTSGFGIIDEQFPQPGSKYGVSIGIDCVDPDKADFVESQISKTACGQRLLEIMRTEGRKRGCQRALVNATGSYSPETLQALEG